MKLEDGKVIIDKGRIYFSCSAFSFTSHIIYLMERFCSWEMAMAAAKVFMVHVLDSSQHSFAIFNLQQNHEEEE